jgi:hypothetical protein
MRAIEEIAEYFRAYDVRPEELIPAGDEVVLVRLRRVGRTHHSDSAISDSFAQVYIVRGERIVSIESFRRIEDARQAIA